jgi:hypothetical protein
MTASLRTAAAREGACSPTHRGYQLPTDRPTDANHTPHHLTPMSRHDPPHMRTGRQAVGRAGGHAVMATEHPTHWSIGVPADTLTLCTIFTGSPTTGPITGTASSWFTISPDRFRTRYSNCCSRTRTRTCFMCLRAFQVAPSI